MIDQRWYRMLRVFIVADDEAIRTDLKEKVDWGAYGCVFVGENDSGGQAFPMIRNLQADIIFSGLHTKDMAGIELNRLVKSSMPWVKTIMIVNQDEVFSAFDACDNEVDGCIEAPIHEHDVKRYLQMFAQTLDKESFSKIYLAKIRENQKIEKRRFFHDLISDRFSATDLLKKSERIHITLGASAYNIVLFKVVEHQPTGIEYSQIQIDILAEIERYISSCPEIIMFDHGRQGFAFLIKEVGERSIEQLTNELIEEMLQIVSGYPDAKYFGGIGDIVYCLKDIVHSYEEASRAFTYRFTVKSNQIFDSNELEECLFTEKTEDKTTSFDITKIDRDIIEQYLTTGSVREVKNFIKAYFFSLGEGNIRSLLFRQYITMDLYYCALSMIERLGYRKEDFIKKCGELKDLGKELATLSGTMDYIERIYTEAITLREEQLYDKGLACLESAKEYLALHYMEDIELNLIAEATNTNPYYLSNLFYERTKQTWIDFLNMERVYHAKILRKDGMEDMEAIAKKVGYQDMEDFDYYMRKYGKIEGYNFD